MDAFYLTIAIIAIIFLILILVFFGLMMKNQNRGAPFPPIENKCPDYWKINENGSCSPSIKSDKSYFNTGSLKVPLTKSDDSAPYASSDNTFDSDSVKWSATGKSSICAKKDWATQNGIVWSGISEYNAC